VIHLLIFLTYVAETLGLLGVAGVVYGFGAGWWGEP
jgi:hypothetical protein